MHRSKHSPHDQIGADGPTNVLLRRCRLLADDPLLPQQVVSTRGRAEAVSVRPGRLMNCRVLLVFTVQETMRVSEHVYRTRRVICWREVTRPVQGLRQPLSEALNLLE